MNKHAIISGIAIVIIVVSFLYSGLNIYTAEQLQYRWSNADKFSFFAMSNGGNVEFCNLTFMWGNFKNFQMDLFYDTKNLGTFNVGSMNVEPSSTSLQYGSFVSDRFVEAQHMFMTLDFEFDGGDIRLDPTKMYVLVTINTPILGVIPYTTSSQYTGLDFDRMMSGEGFDC